MLLQELKRIGLLRIVNSLQKATTKTVITSSKFNSDRVTSENNMNQEFVRGRSLHEVVQSLNKFADLALADTWDNVGLLIEPYTEKAIKNILLTNDLTEDVMQEAINKRTDLIISYHPPIFSPLKRITKGNWKERIVAACLENRIAVYSPHTCWDAIHGGVTDWLGDAFSEYATPDVDRLPLVPNSINKMVEVTLLGSCQTLDALHDKGHLKICNKSKTSDGITFHNIVCTEEMVDELKEIGELAVTGIRDYKKNLKPLTGAGRIIQIKALKISQCVSLIKKHTGLKIVRLALGRGKTEDSEAANVALVPGSGGSLLKSVNADLFVTGEMFHHDILDANHRGVSVILTNHSDSERGFLKKIAIKLQNIFNNDIVVNISSMDCDPLQSV